MRMLGSVRGLLGGLRMSPFTGVAERGVRGLGSAHPGGSGMRNCPNRHCSSCGGGRAPSRRDRAGHSPPPRSPALPVPGSGHLQSPQGPQHAGPAGSPINVFIETNPEPPWAPQHTPLHASVSLTIPPRPHKNSLHVVTISVISPPHGTHNITLKPPVQLSSLPQCPLLQQRLPRTTWTTLQCHPLLSFPHHDTRPTVAP